MIWRSPTGAGCFLLRRLFQYCDEPLVLHRIHGGNHTNAGLAGAAQNKAVADRNAERRAHRFRQEQRIRFVLERSVRVVLN